MFEELRRLCQGRKEKLISDREFVSDIARMFVDDSGMDWCDAPEELNRLMDTIIGAP